MPAAVRCAWAGTRRRGGGRYEPAAQARVPQMSEMICCRFAVYSSSVIASITRSVSSSCRRWAAKGFGGVNTGEALDQRFVVVTSDNARPLACSRPWIAIACHSSGKWPRMRGRPGWYVRACIYVVRRVIGSGACSTPETRPLSVTWDDGWPCWFVWSIVPWPRCCRGLRCRPGPRLGGSGGARRAGPDPAQGVAGASDPREHRGSETGSRRRDHLPIWEFLTF
jgi:hypothetical protein